jgi:hypothetical protein
LSKKSPTILLVGLGHLGGVLLEFLAREEWIGRLIACARNPQRGEARCNLARLSAAAQGLAPDIEFRQTDIFDPPRFAETVDSISPQMILGTATMQTWWLPELLPAEAQSALRQARFGNWLPLHLAPTRSFMEGIRASSYGGPVLTAPFPDVVNCVLGKLGLEPTCGIGNVDEIAAKVRMVAAQRLGAPLAAVHVTLVAHHALEPSVFGGQRDDAPPYFLRVFHEEVDVTDSIEGPDILFAPCPLPAGPGIGFLTAGSTIRLVRALFGQTRTFLHAPSPAGLPGGYPIVATTGQIELAPIPGLEPDDAILINERSHPFDGVQRIEADGTVVFTPDSGEAMRAELGYDCTRLAPDDAFERGRELGARFKEYAARHGVDLDRVA